MTAFSLGDAAVLLAALEVLPGDPQDLTELLELSVGHNKLDHELDKVSNRESELLHYVRSSVEAVRVRFWQAELDRLERDRPNVRLVLATDDDYPTMLRDCFDRPPFIFIDGFTKYAGDSAISVVGSRRAAVASLEFAASVARAAAEESILVVSGLALGVDAAAHEAALDAGGCTAAVLGTGIDVPTYPRAHGSLAERIRDNGWLLSQFRPRAPATRTSFVRRNSVVSGLSRTSIVIEAGERSGTRTEVESALRQGRSVVFWAPATENENWVQRLVGVENIHMVDSVDAALAVARRKP